MRIEKNMVTSKLQNSKTKTHKSMLSLILLLTP